LHEAIKVADKLDKMQQYYRLKINLLIHNSFLRDLFPKESFARFVNWEKSFVDGLFYVFVYKDFVLREILKPYYIAKIPFLTKINEEYSKWARADLT
jgi:hypothetical protein